MIIYATYFSQRGRELLKQIEKLPLTISYGCLVSRYGGRPVQSPVTLRLREGESLDVWLQEAFAAHMPILLVGAAGIAVRAIAPFMKKKTVDSAVLVLDETGKFVIPVLSGHLGGANELAEQIAEGIHGIPVITTATDVNHLFAVDVFARKNGFRVENPEKIRCVSGKVLRGEIITITFDEDCMGNKWLKKPELPDEVEFVPWNVFLEQREKTGERKIVDVLISRNAALFPFAEMVLVPKNLVLGIGCRKGKSCEELLRQIRGLEEEKRFQLCDIAAIASIDVKAEEPGLLELAQRLRVPFYVFSPEELLRVEGTFSSSEFVADTVGVDNVCERAAVAAADGGRLLLKKYAENGITISVGEKYDYNIMI